MTLPRLATRTVLTALLPVLAAATLAPHAAWADINVSPDTAEPSNLTDTLGTLSTDNSTSAKTSNINILQGSINSLNAQINADQRTLSGMSSSNASYPTLQGQIAQLTATANALQRINTRLQAGDTITGYTTSTDASDQSTTITMNFNGGVPLTAYIPPIPESNDSSSSGSGSTGTAATSLDGSDMLTQILQQVAMQLVRSQAPQNPFSNIQSTLNNIVSENASPLPSVTPTPTIPATGSVSGTAMTCMPDGSQAGKGVAVYDISAGKVYMPDGSVLEAHSGLGTMMDNPSYANQRNNGPTPPNTYSLSLRESSFHGVEALRLTPIGDGNMYNRDGLLAHTPMLKRTGTNGSNGCVAFPDYASFLAAFKSGEVKTLVVVAKKSDKQNTCQRVEYDAANPKD